MVAHLRRMHYFIVLSTELKLTNATRVGTFKVCHAMLVNKNAELTVPPLFLPWDWIKLGGLLYHLFHKNGSLVGTKFFGPNELFFMENHLSGGRLDVLYC